MFDPIKNKQNKNKETLTGIKTSPIDIPERKDTKVVIQQLEMLEDIICHQFRQLNNKIK